MIGKHLSCEAELKIVALLVVIKQIIIVCPSFIVACSHQK
jgi:hypothetical protein